MKPNIINSITYENHFQPTLLIHALEYDKNNSIVEYLANHKSCDITVPDQVGNTPFYLAIRNGNLDAVKWLLQNDQSVLNHVTDYRAPLRIAAGLGHVEIVKFLLQQDGIDINVYRGKTVDQVKGIKEEIVKLFQDHGKNLGSTS